MQQKRYWLRGGIFLTALGGICIAIGLVNTSYGDFIPIWSIPATPGMVILHFLGGPVLNINNHNYSALQTITIIISLCFYFLIGLILGWVYGKIKIKKQAGTTMN